MADQPIADSGKTGGRLRRRIWISLLVVFLVVCGVLAGASYYVASALKPVQAQDKPVQVVIPKGVSSSQIADILEQHHLIKSALIFRFYIRYKHEGSDMQAGTYLLTPGMSLDAMIKKLVTGSIVKPPMIKFTIPEGYTVEQIADKLSKEGIVNREKFLSLANQPDLFASKWAHAIPDDPSIRYKLEGYLFPDTYELKKGSTEKEIIQAMLDNLDKKLSQLPEGWQSQMKAEGLTFHQMLTVASMIEREVAVDRERKIVAGVIMNRLKINMPLQIDATIEYILNKPQERLLDKDLKTPSPYNTYLHKGLPPGPIANPGLKSIQAALDPATTQYLYYVTKKDGSHTHLFAVTYSQQLKNIAISMRNAKAVSQQK